MPPHLARERLRKEQYASANNLNARAALHQRFSTNPYGWQRWVFDHVADVGGADILEVGCGPGTLWHSNRERVPAHWRITLSDFSLGMLTEARRPLADSSAFRFAVLDIGELAVDDAAFDCIVANHMLYHVADRPAALREVARALRPGGTFIAATNGISHLAELDQLAVGLGFDMQALSSLPFTLQNGEAQLRAVFDDVRCAVYDDSLEVTDAEVIVAYLLSIAGNTATDSIKVAELRADVERRIERDGCFAIRKEAGLFLVR